MTQDFFLGQLRLIAVAILAYGAGAHWFTPDQAGFYTALLTPVGLLIGPWLWSVYRNINMKLVPKDSIAIAPEAVTNNVTAVKSGIAIIPEQNVKVVG